MNLGVRRGGCPTFSWCRRVSYECATPLRDIVERVSVQGVVKTRSLNYPAVVVPENPVNHSLYSELWLSVTICSEGAARRVYIL